MTTPMNISFADKSKFRLSFPFMDFLSTPSKNEKGDGVTLFCNTVSLPSVGITQTKIGTPYYDMKIGNRGMNWGDLAISYAVDELYSNYNFIYKWFMYMNDPEVYKMGNVSGMVDATLYIYSNNDNPKLKFLLKNIFPIQLNGIDFSKEAMDSEDIKHQVVFSVDYYKLEID